MNLQIDGDAALIADFRDFPGRTTRAMVRALNRALVSGRTVMVRAIAQDTGLKQGDVRKAMPQREATFQRPRAELASSLKRRPLIEFKARQTGKGVSYDLGRGRKVLSHAFIARMRSGHTGVFMRRGKRRLPIKEKRGVSLGHVFRKFRPQGLEAMRASFVKNFDHELQFQRTQGGPGAGAD